MMKPLPHRYTVIAAGATTGEFVTLAEGLPPLEVGSPPEFGGSGECWSPEGLLTAAVANCFVLTFRSVAAATHAAWTLIECDVIGTLDRVERAMQFTHFEIRARVEVPHAGDVGAALRALDKAHHSCLIANSLKSTIELRSEVYSADMVSAG